MLDLQLEKKYWVALSTHGKIGARTIIKLFKRFKKLSILWQTKENELFESGFDQVIVRAILETIKTVNPDNEMIKLQKFGVKAMILPESDYPQILREIADPPAILYYKGEILPQDSCAIGVVGSRKFTNYGERAVAHFVYPLAKNGVTIVSGLALGIDTLAHKAALEGGARTLAVLGCGLDQIYPSSNLALADKIINGRGAIISEFPLGMPAYRSNFPMRNRIIAGLSLGTLVVEGAIDSGSLITARAALDYNREVFAVPGPIFSETSEGPNRLIQMGAKMVIDVNDILTELNLGKANEIEVQQIIPDTEDERVLLKLLQKPTLVDDMIKESKMSPPLVNTTLIMLEMKGYISNLGGTRYVIKGKLIEK